MSRYIESGVLPFALMLEQNGFERYTVEGEKQLLDFKPYKKKESICYKCGKKFFVPEHDKKNKNYHKFKTAKYVIVTGPGSNFVSIDVQQAVKKFSDKDNKYGSEIKVFLGTDVIKEGVDFSNIRQLFIMEPWYNVSSQEQKIGRAIRFCSHVTLKNTERNVEIFKMATSNNDSNDKKIRETETADERRYRNAELKDYKIKDTRHILKRSAIDCVPYKKRNLYTSKKKVKQITSRGEVIEISKNDKPYSIECDYQKDCNFECVWEPKGKIKIDTDTYDLIFDKSDIEKIKKRINKLFKKDIVFEISGIKDYILEAYPDIEERFIYKALEELINNNEYIYDKFSRKGKLIYSGDYYIFEPQELSELKLPIVYREKPLKIKPSKMKLIDYKLSILNNKVSNHKKNNNKKNKTKNINILNEKLTRIIADFEKFDYMKKLDNSKNNFSYNKALIGTFLEKFDVKLYIEFVKYIIQFSIENDKDNYFLSKNQKIVKLIIDFLDNQLIINDRDISEKSIKKGEIYGFRLNEEYYHYNRNKKKWESCKSYIIRQVQNYIKTLKKSIEQKNKNKEKNNVVGILSKNKRNNVIFQLIDFDKYKFAKTQKDKKSKRSELKGQVCKTIDRSILSDMRNKLNLPDVKKKKTRIYICDEIEIFLRINSYNNKDNKIWLINKNL